MERLRDELAPLAAQEKDLARELFSVEAQLRAGASRPPRLPLLSDVRVASPCGADWEEMVGDEKVRFCLSCEKNVFNLSGMGADEAERLLAERAGGTICVRYYQRSDGTILTSDCPTGARRKRRRKLALAAVAGAGAALAAASATLAPPAATMGEMPVTTRLAPPIEEPHSLAPSPPEPRTPEVHPEPKQHVVLGRMPVRR